MSEARYRSLAFVHPYLDAPGAPPGLVVEARGRLATVTDAAAIRQCLLLLLSTRPGERVNRPEYGCHLSRLAFAPADDTTAGLAVHYVARAVERWEPRVQIVSIDAQRPGGEPAIEVRVRYRVRASQQEDELGVTVPVDGRPIGDLA